MRGGSGQGGGRGGRRPGVGGVWGGRGRPQAAPSPPRTDEINSAATTACGMKSAATMAGVIKFESLSFFLHGPAANSNRVGLFGSGFAGASCARKVPAFDVSSYVLDSEKKPGPSRNEGAPGLGAGAPIKPPPPSAEALYSSGEGECVNTARGGARARGEKEAETRQRQAGTGRDKAETNRKKQRQGREKQKKAEARQGRPEKK